MKLSNGTFKARLRTTRAAHVDCLVDARSDFARSFVWDARTHRLFWIDSPVAKLFCVSLMSGVVQSWSLPCMVAGIALCGDARILTVLVDGIYLFDPATHDLDFLAALDASRPDQEFEDVGIGPDGAIWITGAGRDAPGRIHRVTLDGTVTQIMASDATRPSGLCWSSDGTTMYGAHTAGWIGRWAFDPSSGSISEGARIVECEEPSVTTGAGAVDAEGAYWSCDTVSGSVTRFTPDGKLDTRISLPIPRPTACCFGGPDMKLLFVGSRRAGLSAQQLLRAPISGGIFMIRVNVAGVPARRFQVSEGGQ